MRPRPRRAVTLLAAAATVPRMRGERCAVARTSYPWVVVVHHAVAGSVSRLLHAARPAKHQNTLVVRIQTNHGVDFSADTASSQVVLARSVVRYAVTSLTENCIPCSFSFRLSHRNSGNSFLSFNIYLHSRRRGVGRSFTSVFLSVCRCRCVGECGLGEGIIFIFIHRNVRAIQQYNRNIIRKKKDILINLTNTQISTMSQVTICLTECPLKPVLVAELLHSGYCSVNVRECSWVMTACRCQVKSITEYISEAWCTSVVWQRVYTCVTRLH